MSETTTPYELRDKINEVLDQTTDEATQLDALIFAIADFNAAGVRLAIMHLEEIAMEKETLDRAAQEKCDGPVRDTSGVAPSESTVGRLPAEGIYPYP
jgi:hypothetical protein